MSGPSREPGAAPAITSDAEPTSLLDRVVSATRQTEPDRAEALVRALVEQANRGIVAFDRNLPRTIEKAIAALDRTISAQLNEIVHDPHFLKLEGAWRGLHYMVMNSETGVNLKIRLLHATKRELHRDLTRAVEFDQSLMFRKIYENEFGTPGGEPYGALIGDYEWTNHPEDIESLRLISNVSAAAFAPFISAAGAGMMGSDQWTELSRPRDLAKIFDTVEYLKWRGFRDSEDSRFVSLVMPRVLARLPYGERTRQVDAFAYEEAPLDPQGGPLAMDHERYCWMNAAYVTGAKLTDAFARNGFCTAIRGAEGGGRVDDLPQHIFQSDDGDLDAKCPTEIGITDRREYELSNLGFLPLCHYKNHDFAVFFGAQTTQKPKDYDRPEASANARISARLPYIMAASRFSHYLKVMVRDKIGSFMEAENCEGWLNRWIKNYVNTNEKASAESKAKFPLREARVELREVPGRPGAFNAIAYMRPWLQMEELTTSLRWWRASRNGPDRGAPAVSAPALRDEILAGRLVRPGYDGLPLQGFLRDDRGALAGWFGEEAAGLRADAARLRCRVDQDVAAIDGLIAAQLDAVLHHPRLQRLEGSWRGLAWLVEGVEPGTRLRIRLLSAGWEELERDLARVVEFDQSALFRHLYENEFGSPGGEPFGLLVVDHVPRPRGTGKAAPVDDVSVLGHLADIAAAAFLPMVLAADPVLLGVDRFEDFALANDAAAALGDGEHARWRALSARENARFLCVTMPRVLARPRWRTELLAVSGLRYEEHAPGAGTAAGRLRAMRSQRPSCAPRPRSTGRPTYAGWPPTGSAAGWCRTCRASRSCSGGHALGPAAARPRADRPAGAGAGAGRADAAEHPAVRRRRLRRRAQHAVARDRGARDGAARDEVARGGWARGGGCLARAQPCCRQRASPRRSTPCSARPASPISSKSSPAT